MESYESFCCPPHHQKKSKLSPPSLKIISKHHHHHPKKKPQLFLLKIKNGFEISPPPGNPEAWSDQVAEDGPAAVHDGGGGDGASLTALVEFHVCFHGALQWNSANVTGQTSNHSSLICSGFFTSTALTSSTGLMPDQHTVHRTEHVVTLY